MYSYVDCVFEVKSSLTCGYQAIYSQLVQKYIELISNLVWEQFVMRSQLARRSVEVSSKLWRVWGRS